MQLKDMKVVVTGGASGMGRHFSLRLAEAGAQVAAGDVNEEGLKSLQAESAGKPGKVHVRKLDVASDRDCEEFAAWAAKAMGGLNGLVNNAGILRDGLLVKKDRETGEIKKLSREQWQAVIDVNLTGATWMARECVAQMITLGSPGVIVNMSSLARYGNRGQSNYSAAKAALAANTKTWGLEFAQYGIRVGAVAPGMVETPMTAGMNPKAREALVKSIPLGRIGTPEDLWIAVKFVIECDYFTGRTIDVDGGAIL
jgi:3-oxoacyl-[acyl-carrier protein] reductase